MHLNHNKSLKVVETKTEMRSARWSLKHLVCKSQSVIEHNHSFIVKACFITCRQLYLQNNKANGYIFMFSICTRFTRNGFHEFVLLSKKLFTRYRKELFTWNKTANSTTETKRSWPTPIWYHCTRFLDKQLNYRHRFKWVESEYLEINWA